MRLFCIDAACVVCNIQHAVSHLRVGSSRLVTSLVAIGHMVLQTPKLLDEVSLKTLETFVLSELLSHFTVTCQLLSFIIRINVFSGEVFFYFSCIICSTTTN